MVPKNDCQIYKNQDIKNCLEALGKKYNCFNLRNICYSNKFTHLNGSIDSFYLYVGQLYRKFNQS